MIRLEDVSKIYRAKNGEVRSLDGVNLHVAKGEFVVVRGSSGSGKTTLLLAIGGMLRPTKGKVEIEGRDIYALDGPARAAYRAESVGFVFQMFHLVPYLTVLDNVLLASGVGSPKPGRKDAEDLLAKFGLSERIHHTPGELSAGEKQRTALARALLRKPRLLLADEPTGNLDPDNAKQVVAHMADFQKDGGSVIIVTHGEVADAYASRVVRLEQGKIQ